MKHLRLRTILPLLCILILTAPCKKALYAPGEGDIIQLSAAAAQVMPGDSVLITLSGIKANGQPMPDNTLVLLASEAGIFIALDGKTVEAVRLVGGKAQVNFRVDVNFSGDAVAITAGSGAATVTPEQLVIGFHVIEITQLFINAAPLALPSGGGTVEITITAYDSETKVVPGKEISFETTTGTLTPGSPIKTNDNGAVSTTLATTESAEVTAFYKEVTKSVEIAVGENQPPVAAFEFSPQNPLMGETIYFVSTSTDADGSIDSYQWSFGDGKPGSILPNPTHDFPRDDEAKEYQVVLTVTDNHGSMAGVAQTVSFAIKEEVPLAADFVFSPTDPGPGDPVYFNAEASTGPDEDNLAYDWDFGDGKDHGEGKTTEHEYTGAGTYTVTLILTDNDSGDTANVSKEVTVVAVENQPPVAVFTFLPSAPRTGDTVTFDATGSTDADGTIKEYHWDFGGGDTVTGEKKKVEHTYHVTDTTDFEVTLTVTDDSGAQGTLTQVVTVTENQKPIADFTASPKKLSEGNRVYFSAEASYDPDGEIDDYHWDFGDGVTRNGPETSRRHLYGDVNTDTTYNVTLTVTDKQGAIAQMTIEIEVIDIDP